MIFLYVSGNARLWIYNIQESNSIKIVGTHPETRLLMTCHKADFNPVWSGDTLLFNDLIQEADQEHAMDITMCVMDVTNAVAWLHVALKFGKLWCGRGIQFQGDILVYMAMFD